MNLIKGFYLSKVKNKNITLNNVEYTKNIDWGGLNFHLGSIVNTEIETASIGIIRALIKIAVPKRWYIYQIKSIKFDWSDHSSNLGGNIEKPDQHIGWKSINFVTLETFFFIWQEQLDVFEERFRKIWLKENSGFC